jgi:hypothetical protein
VLAFCLFLAFAVGLGHKNILEEKYKKSLHLPQRAV